MLTKYQMGVPMEGWNDCPDLPNVTTTARRVSSGRKKRPQRVGHDFGATSISTPSQSPSPSPSAVRRIPSATSSYSPSPGPHAQQTLQITQAPPTPISTPSLPIPTGACQTAGTATQAPVSAPTLASGVSPISSHAS